MKKIGMIAGGGNFPLEFAKAVKRQGDKIVVFAIIGLASEKLNDIADKIYWLNIGQFTKFTFLLLKERVRELILLGKINKNVIYNEKIDKKAQDMMNTIKNNNDYSVLEAITKKLKILGIKVTNGRGYLTGLLPARGCLTQNLPEPSVQEDISFGYGIIKKIAGMDIGQTIIVKNKAVVAVEAMEGTNETIKRGKQIAGEGCVMVKVARPDQDMRWDVPVVGLETIAFLVEHGYKALAIESKKMYLIEKDQFLQLADNAGISVQVL